ncbi:MAG TPA: hypothetical protein VJN62_04170 [Gemmatimonadales bacterium]|nr:hypothetical protein [Gemmatimonadales bacterium]
MKQSAIPHSSSNSRATFEEILANVRKNIVGRDRAHVRRTRRFTLRLVDPVTRPDRTFITPEAFFGPYDRAIRPLLEKATRCRVFFRPGIRGTLDPRSAKAIAERGEDPQRWGSYLDASAEGEVPLPLSRAVLDDRLFWWWMFVRPAGCWTPFVVPVRELELGTCLRETYDPHFSRWSFDADSAIMRAFTFAKGETSSGAFVTFIPMHRNGLEVVAKVSEAERLFREASASCRVSERLRARG